PAAATRPRPASGRLKRAPDKGAPARGRRGSMRCVWRGRLLDHAQVRALTGRWRLRRRRWGLVRAVVTILALVAVMRQPAFLRQDHALPGLARIHRKHRVDRNVDRLADAAEAGGEPDPGVVDV